MTPLQIKIIKAIQESLPVSKTPFKEVADRVGIPEDDLLAQLRAWKLDGTIRRFGSILRHQNAGYSANAMCVWNVPNDRIENFARVSVEYGAVSHCYQRPRFADFEYNLYTMIHGKSKEDCELVIAEISERTGVTDYAILTTVKEFKKSSPIYYQDVIE